MERLHLHGHRAPEELCRHHGLARRRGCTQRRKPGAGAVFCALHMGKDRTFKMVGAKETSRSKSMSTKGSPCGKDSAREFGDGAASRVTVLLESSPREHNEVSYFMSGGRTVLGIAR